MKTVVVVGATGHVGSALCHELKARGGCYIKGTYFAKRAPYLEGVCDEQIQCDIADTALLTKLFEGADAVFHIAGFIWIAKGRKKQINATNIQGTKNIIEACRISGVPDLIYASSVHAIDFDNLTDKLSEKSVYEPRKVHGHYGKSKAAAANLVMAADCPSLRTVVLMPTGVIGRYCYRLSNLGQMIKDYSLKKIPIYFDGRYNFVDTEDIAVAFCNALTRGEGGTSYLLSGDNAEIIEMFKILSELSGVKVPKIKLPVWFVKMLSYPMELISLMRRKMPTFSPYSVYTLHSNCNCDNSKARRDLGFKSRPFAQSLKAQYDFMKEAGMLKK